MLRASHEMFGPDGLDDTTQPAATRRSSKSSQVTCWYVPKLCVQSHEPKFYLKSLMKSDANYAKEVATIHTKLKQQPPGKRLVVPKVPTLASAGELVRP